MNIIGYTDKLYNIILYIIAASLQQLVEAAHLVLCEKNEVPDTVR